MTPMSTPPDPQSAAAATRPAPPCGSGRPAFTLVELMVAMTILTVILLTLAAVVQQTTRSWGLARGQLEQFREAEVAFDAITRRISDAVLNTYYDYEFPGGNTSQTPTRYVRQSELHFVSGQARAGSATPPLLPDLARAAAGHAVFFQGPFGDHDTTDWTGLNTLLNSWGYFVTFGDDSDRRPAFLSPDNPSPRHRFRLVEFRQPAEEFLVYREKLSATGTSPATLYRWFRQPVTTGGSLETLAENVVALILRPLAPEGDLDRPTDLAPSYHYDTRAFQHNVGGAFQRERSRHQLPPLLEITLVVMDEASAVRLQSLHGDQPPDFGIGSLFQNAAAFDDDIQTLAATLDEQRVSHRILTRTVRLRNARWSAFD